MKVKRYFYESVITASMLLVLLALSKTSPTTAVSPTTKYIPPDVIDPKILLDNLSVQKRTGIVQGKREQRGFGMGFQLRSNFWVDNEEISLVEYATDYADTWVTLYGPGKKEPKLQVVEILSWGANPLVALGVDETDVGYFAGHGHGYLLVYPEITSEDQFKIYCAFYKKHAEEHPEQKFGPVLSYEYFSGRLDGKPKWGVVDKSCFDFLAFSSYPTRIYHSIKDLSDDYYDDAVVLFPDSEIIFADVGWSAAFSSERDQSLFLEQLYSFAKKRRNIVAIIYGHLFDPFGDALYYYEGVGLISSDEIAKPALVTWRRLFDLGEER